MPSIDTTLRRAQLIFHRVRNYYRLYGAIATARRISSYVLRRNVASAPEAFQFRGAVPGEIVIPYEKVRLVPVKLLAPSTTLVQEVDVDLDSITRIAVLCTPAKLDKIRVAVLTAQGKLVYDEELSLSAVKRDGFLGLSLKTPLEMGEHRTLRLVVGIVEGAKRALTLWGNDHVDGRFYTLSAGFSDVVERLQTSPTGLPAPLRRSLVYKISGVRIAPDSAYDLPPSPPDFADRCMKEVVRILTYVARDAALPEALLKMSSHDADLEIVDNPRDALERIRNGRVDHLLFATPLPIDEARRLVHAAYLRYVPSIFFVDAVGERSRFNGIQSLTWCSFALCRSSTACKLASAYRKHVFVLPERDDREFGYDATSVWKQISASQLKRYRPLVSIVTLLYRKAVEIPHVLQSYFDQTYEGPLEIVFVDDASPDDSVAIAKNWIAHRTSGVTGVLPEVRFVHNERNLGNCTSRNIGIRHAKGDILVIVDADCMLNRDYVKHHVEAHAFDDCEVVIGPMNIETRGRDPNSALLEYEGRTDLAAAQSELQDPLNRNSFLNCITRNFSIKSAAITSDLFDPLFGYSADPSSGFGWEDVEMGYRLYTQGARVKYISNAVAIHVSSPGDLTASSKPLRSMLNFRRLLEKHPDLELVGRRWASGTFRRISEWAARESSRTNEDWGIVEGKLAKYRTLSTIADNDRRYRVLTYRWHVSHQYELYKLPFDFTLVTGLGTSLTDSWDLGIRPMPANARFVSADRIDPANYDFAILHFDENVLAPENTNGVIGPDWGRAFQWFVEQISLPKIAVCHGTPQFYGQYDINYDKPNLLQVIESERVRLVDYLGDIPVIVNSHQAQREWRFRKSKVIWHGFDPADFPPATYERSILSPLGPLVTSRPHYRGYFLYRKVFDQFPAEVAPDTLQVPEPHVLYSGNAYALAKYRNYVDEIRRYSVYFNPTQRSPMPRARGEPMMCGVVTVSAQNHDVDMFIKNGVNGFYSNDSDELREILLDLMRHPDAARRIGAQGRRTAMDVFNHDRYLTEWLGAISDLLGERIKRPKGRAIARSAV